MHTQLKLQAAEPLRRSDTIMTAMKRTSAHSAGSSSSSAAAASILNAEKTSVWRTRVGLARSSGAHDRVRLSKDVYDLWHPFRSRPANVEMNRPWLFMFHFTDQQDTKQHYYAWT
eukprot:2486684-Karenia_brevis.AAC.1